MTTYKIDGKGYTELLLGGATVLSEHIAELNALNVFPVADGDTGTNMFSTVEGGLAALRSDTPDSIGEVARIFARAVLLSARGNSGVILSQIFAGICEHLRDCDQVRADQLAAAYVNGIKSSYASVQNPTEGTILTVFRESTEYAASRMTFESTIEDFFRLHVEEARRSLARTPDLLPPLAEAEVVDSGAAGYLFIAEGMYGALIGEVSTDINPCTDRVTLDIDRFTRDSKLEFGYCTEFLLRLTNEKVNPDVFDVNAIITDLIRLGGESIVAYKQDDIVKVHVHSFTPGLILSEAQKYGEFLTVKIENMSLGHSESVKPKKRQRKKYATVAVAIGDGISALFTDMGVDYIVSGGQTANPSIEEFIRAFDSLDAECIIVLPNNKNILLAAEAAARTYEGARICVIPTKTLPQGYASLSVMNPSSVDIDAMISAMTGAADSVVDCEITRAVRNTRIDGRDIFEGDYIAIRGGNIVASEKTAEDAALEMLEGCDADLCEMITLFVGAGVSIERRVSLTDRIRERYPDLELVVYEGGQEIYDYLIAIE